MKVAALYVDRKGPYWGREDVDAWDEERDARLYQGPYPVVAHPPCNRWGRFWWRGKLGDDGGCFEAALKAVETFGGVLEHPEGTLAWARFGLPVPTHGEGWRRGLFDKGWACSVDQSLYGHRARKRTWLYFVGKSKPADLDWRHGPSHVLVARNARTRRLGLPTMTDPLELRLSPPPIRVPSRGPRVGVEIMTKSERRLTPEPFAAILIGLAS